MSVRRSAALTLAAAVLLAGCQDEPGPRVEPSPTESESESVPSEEPEGQTAEEFIRMWVDLDTEMQNTGETDRYRAVSRQCEPCQAVADRVERAYERGGSLKTSGWKVKSIDKVEGPDRYRLSGTSTPTTIVEEEGADEVRLEGGPIHFDFVLRKTASGWQVVDLLEIAS